MSGIKGNYWPAVAVLLEQLHRCPAGIVVPNEDVNDGCGYWKGHPCDCEPDVEAQTERRQRGGAER